jgi:hypothetical protein
MLTTRSLRQLRLITLAVKDLLGGLSTHFANFTLFHKYANDGINIGKPQRILLLQGASTFFRVSYF